MQKTMVSLEKWIRDVPDFPKKGILFKDITPLLQNAEAFSLAVQCFLDRLKGSRVDFVAGIESRGFIFAPILAERLKAGFIPIRKKGKLPYKTQSVAYALEYGEAVLEMHEDAVPSGAKVIIVDDLLATGGTALAAAELVKRSGGKVEKFLFLIELLFLRGREKLSGYEVVSLLQY